MNDSDPRPTTASRPHPHPWRRRLLIGAAALCLLVASYAAAGFWLAPRVVGDRLPAFLAERYGLNLTLGALRFNPFRFDLEADDIALRGPDGAPLLQAGRLAVDYSPSGLFRGRWTFDSVRLAALQVNLVVAKDGTLNLVDLLHRFAGPASAPAAAPPRIVVDRLDLAAAAVAVTDLRGDAPAIAKFAPIDLSLTGLSTLPGEKTTQTLTATLPDGATLRSQGELVLEPALQANGRFDLQGLQAARWAPFLGSLLRIDRLQGGVSLSATYAYAPDPGLRLDAIGLQVTDLLLAATGVPAPLIALKKIDISGGRLDLNARQVALAKVSLAQGTASVAIAADGRVGWSELVPPAAAGAASSVPAPAWQVSAAAVALDHVGLDYTDRQHAPPWVATVAAVDGSLKLAASTGATTGVTAAELALRVQGIALPAAHDGGPALKLDTLAVEGGAFDLAARSVAAQSVSIDGGHVAAAREADGAIDWVRRYAPPAAAAPAASAGAAWHYDIGKLSVGGIDVALTDRTQTPAFDYGLRLDSATAQHLANVDAAPVRFDARVTAKPGGTLTADGSIAADGSGLKARVELDRLALAPFAGLAEHATGFGLGGGPLTLATNLHDAGGGFALDDLSVDLPNLQVKAPAGAEPLFSAAQLQVRGGRVSLAEHRVVVDRLTVAKGAVRAERRPDGRLEGQAPAPPRSTAKPPANAPTPAWDVRVAALQLQQMAVHWLDRARPAPLRLDVGQVDLGLALQAATGGTAVQVAAQGVQATVKDVAVGLGSGQPPALSLASASLSDGRLDLAARRFGATRLALSGGSTRVVRDAKGRIDLLEAFAAAPAAAPSTAAAPSAPWQYAVDKIVLQRFGLTARDRSTSPPLALDAQLDATLDRLASTGPAAFDATLAFAKSGGSVKATGSVTPATGSARAHFVAAGLDLTPLQPLLARYTTVQLGSGRAGSDVTLTYSPGAVDALKVTGAASLENLSLDEAGSATHLLSFARLDATKLAFASGGPRLEIGAIDIARPDARIAIAKDRSVNFAQVVKHSADDPPAAPAAPTTPASAPAFGVSVQQVRLHDARVDFSDQSLVLPFATRVEAIDATLVGLSNDPARRADVQARGSIEPYGSASVDGNLSPADPRRHTDLEVKFNNVTLQPFSPYTATFAGRKVQSGKLWLDLGYKIDDGQLLGTNDIRLSQFTLGEPVESPSALNLPLNLAVSLLTDSKGEINLSVPVRGDLDNPHFSVGDAIGQAVKNTLGRIVSAPFRLIGRLFGSDGGESLARVDFGAGSAELGPEQREKLDTLAKALAERPLLQLVVGAPYDAAADTLALQRAAARRQLAARLGRDPAEAGADSLVAFDDPKTREALRSLAAQGGAAAAEPAADDRAAYEAMFDRVARQESLGADSPQILATRRAGTIAKYLTEHGIDRSRVRTGAVEAVAADGDGSVDAALTVSTAGAAG